MEKIDVPLHYDSLFLNQTCYNFVDDWTYENETNIDSTDDGEFILEESFFNSEALFFGDLVSDSKEGSGENSGRVQLLGT